MLYTPLSYEDIHTYQQNNEQYEMITHQNKPMVVANMDDGKKQIIQLLSTNPNDFLTDEFYPGKIIST